MSGSALTSRARQCRAQQRRARRASIVFMAIIIALVVLVPVSGQGAAPMTEAEILFRFPVGGVVTAGPSLGDGRAWLLSDAKTLYVLTVDGVAIGKKDVAERRSAYIVCDAFGRAAVSTGASTLALMNKAGQEVWRTDTKSAVVIAPVFASDGRLFVATSDSLLAYAPNGRRLWKATLPAAPSSTLVIGPGGGPAVGLADGRLVLFSPNGGQAQTAQFDSRPLVITAGAGNLLAALEDGRVEVFRAGNGSTEPVRLGSKPVAVAASADGFYALGADGTLLALNLEGIEAWRQIVKLDGGPASLAAFDGRVIVLTKTAVRSFGPDGSIFRTLALTNSATMPVVAPNGAVIVGGADWILYAYRFERALAQMAPARIASIDMDALDAVAREEALWSSASWSDDTAMERLRDIEKSLKSGTIEVDAEQTVLYLASVAFGRMDAPFGSGAVSSGPTPRGPLPRMMACNVLGQMGLPQAVPILVEVFRLDPDPVVRSAAALAVATIGLDPGGKALEAFALAAEGRLDERIALAMVDAIDRLYKASGALDNRSGLLALVRIAGGEYSRDLQSRAAQALRRLSSVK